MSRGWAISTPDLGSQGPRFKSHHRQSSTCDYAVLYCAKTFIITPSSSWYDSSKRCKTVNHHHHHQLTTMRIIRSGVCERPEGVNWLVINYPFSCWTWICPAFANSVDPDQASKKPKDLDLHLAIQYVNLYQSGSSHLIGWKFEKGVAS